MFNKFAAALIAVAVTADSGNYGEVGELSRGDGTGDSQKNAVHQNMLANPGANVNTNVWSYMAVKNGEPIPEWHGDTVAYGAGLPKDLKYGFCARIHEASDAVEAVEAVAEVTDEDGNVTTPAVEAVDAVDAKDETWDCQVIEVTISPGTVEEPISEESTWAIWDMHYVGTKQNFSFATATTLADDTKNDGAIDSDAKAERNWQMSYSKTFTACYPNASDANKVDCDRPALDADDETWMKSGINAHWFRDFETGSDPHQDLNLTGDFTEDATATIFAFLWGWNTAPATDSTAPDLEVLNGGANWASSNPYEMTLFTSEAYDELITQPAAEAAAAAAAAAALEEEEEEECPEDDADHACHDDHDHGDDGATSITAQATVLLAAIYTLAF